METAGLSGNAALVAWVCFALGAILMLAGVVIGLYLSLKKVSTEVEKKVEEARESLDGLRGAAIRGARAAEADEGAADDAEEKAEQVKSKLEQIASLIGSLPENLRFAGLLILVGAVLMSVATVQFGGVSLF